MKQKYVTFSLICALFIYLLICLRLFMAIDRGVDSSGASTGMQLLDQLVSKSCQCNGWTDIGSMDSLAISDGISRGKAFTDNICYLTDQPKQDAQLQMYSLYQTMHMGYPQYFWTHTGWYEQFDITYSTSQWNKEPLEVFVVLHSHNDPGWTSSFELHYTDSTKHILSKALSFLQKDSELKFCWTEVVYLRKWFENLSEHDKDSFRKLVWSGRFEILSGGWVMADEATGHYQAMLDQLTDGHQWLHSRLNITIDHGMVTDTFGHSPTMAYFFQRAGLKDLIIQRTHYATKKHLALSKQLEFQWRQGWDVSGSTELLCHMAPFLLYNIVYNCGPDINICCQFDFYKNKCWKGGKYVSADKISDQNVMAKAELLLDQYRKKAQLFSHNKLLVLHGDDFRYSSDVEWNDQVSNLKRLFAVMNSSPHMKVKVKFATPGEYMDAVQSEFNLRHLEDPKQPPAPSLTGDFFTYSDRGEQYWSGYYTSRPYLKTLIRLLQTTLRTVEVLFSQCIVRQPGGLVNTYLSVIDEARQTLALMHHHDAITGTARKSVVKDYTARATVSLRATEQLAGKLTTCVTSGETPPTDQHYILLGDHSHSPSQKVIKGQTSMLAVVNSLAVPRELVVRAQVTSSGVYITDSNGKPVPCQLNPVLDKRSHFQVLTDVYEVVFVTLIPGLGIEHYKLEQGSEMRHGACVLADLDVHSAIHQHDLADRLPFVVHWDGLGDIRLENHQLTASFCTCSGLLQGITTKPESIPHKAELRFLTYGTGSWKNPLRDKSGAYIFLPDGAAKMLDYTQPVTAVVRGPLVSSVTAYIPMVTHTATLYNISGVHGASVHLENTVDLGTANNLELAMRLYTNLDNKDRTFYTDLNSFQVHKRRYQSRLDIQGNFYPMTSLAYMEDQQTRISLLAAQSHGVASLSAGEMEAVLDRRLAQDDWRGLREGVLDNRPTVSCFSLLIEKPQAKPVDQSVHDERTMGYPSLLAHLAVHSLNSPPHLFYQPSTPVWPANHAPLAGSTIPCDMHLLNMRVVDITPHQAHIILHWHRLGVDCRYWSTLINTCPAAPTQVSLATLFNDRIHKLSKTTLTGIKSFKDINLKKNLVWTVDIPPMEIETYKLELAL